MAAEEVIVDVDIEVARLKMKKWRDEGYRNSDEVIDLGEHLLEHANKLGDEVWLLCEQVCIAALDVCRLDLAEDCVRTLRKQFPNSSRVLRLTGMLWEAEQDYKQADLLYSKMLEDDPANLSIRKRKIAMLKAQNKIPETISEMNKYLQDFMGDQEAWMELAELYIREMDYPKAAFCMEELILTHPHNHLFHQRFAEIQYTIGTQESVEKARKYFAQALKLDPNNVRALYGLFLSSSLNPQSSKSASKKSINAKVSQWSAQQVFDALQVAVPEKQRRALDEMFSNMQLSLPPNAGD